MNIRYSPNRLRAFFLILSLLLVVLSVLYATRLANRLADEERKKMEIWAEATRQFILADENTDIDFVSSIIEQNTTIPVYMVDAEGNFLLSRNVKEPKQHVDDFYKKKIDKLRQSQQPIEVRISGDIVQYIYYEESNLLRQLHYFPYIEFTIILLFLLITIITLYTVQHSEQNRVWVGLSKETAHQLGTPISSLMAWNELLSQQYPHDMLIPEMNKDISRLQTIAERFSKIGSEPTLQPMEIIPILQDSIDYMRSRTSDKISYQLHTSPSDSDLCANLNRPLFQWVLENLCKNAVDAMEGNNGQITLNVARDSGKIFLDLSDTGKGIKERYFKSIFLPGYTTKQRGWGLGLSLAKRIIEDYHKGKIFVKESQVGVGTTFRIVLNAVEKK